MDPNLLAQNNINWASDYNILKYDVFSDAYEYPYDLREVTVDGENSFYYWGPYNAGGSVNNVWWERASGRAQPTYELFDIISIWRGLGNSTWKLLKQAFTKTGTQTGTKAIAQFSGRTIDDAVSLTMKQKGTHIFANKIHPKPWLNQLSTKMGGNQNVIRAALENANGRIIPDAQGVFKTPVNVGGVDFMIRGYMNQGIPIINTIFIP